MKEIWIDIKGYEGLYQVSNLGQVKSLDRIIVCRKTNAKRKFKGCILIPTLKPFGYPWVSLHKDGKKHTKLIHRLVAEAFIPNPDNLPCVNHKDENPSNANVNNLEWCTQQYNVLYSGLQNRKRWQNIIKPVLQYDKQMNLIKEWNTITEASKYYNIPVTNISKCCKGKRKTCHKYIWKYKN